MRKLHDIYCESIFKRLSKDERAVLKRLYKAFKKGETPTITRVDFDTVVNLNVKGLIKLKGRQLVDISSAGKKLAMGIF
jgi:hypothetical protein